MVEGSLVCNPRTHADLLNQLWRVEIPRAIGCVKPDYVFGISKASVAAMKLRQMPFQRTTSIAEPLDALLERRRRQYNVDCFVVVWDLLPPWDKDIRVCRWNETLALYEGLSLSSELASSFREFAARRFDEMRKRSPHHRRDKQTVVESSSVIAVCMEPLFEVGFMDERAMKQCLGIVGRHARGWPGNWRRDNRNADHVVEDAIHVVRQEFPHLELFRKLRQDYDQGKTEWGIHFANSRSFDRSLRTTQFGHRLAEMSC